MAQKKKAGVADFLKTQADVFAGRVADFQKEADRLAADLSARGQSQLRELEKLVSKFEGMPWGERSAELTERAKGFGGELAQHFEELQGKVAHFVGVATRDQVADLASELKKLSKKIDGLSKPTKQSRTKRVR